MLSFQIIQQIIAFSNSTRLRHPCQPSFKCSPKAAVNLTPLVSYNGSLMQEKGIRMSLCVFCCKGSFALLIMRHQSRLLASVKPDRISCVQLLHKAVDKEILCSVMRDRWCTGGDKV
ncbi:hypothetical protein CHARACLAT_016393 [Characodon lateralis]|uniref:Uncharacterized protein n=1 Tax=Characodon lateralis TaxID=208331 RepID=A0ABU7CPI3_9TELE|nr:hypothetical protein [Characodon lateralis]